MPSCSVGPKRNKRLASQNRGCFKNEGDENMLSSFIKWRCGDRSFTIRVSVRDGRRVVRRWASIGRSVAVIVVYRRFTWSLDPLIRIWCVNSIRWVSALQLMMISRKKVKRRELIGTPKVTSAFNSPVGRMACWCGPPLHVPCTSPLAGMCDSQVNLCIHSMELTYDWKE